ncbi:aspartate aminotransferase [Frigidibacter sp. SD6-1]|uniref:aspartate aminotransferase n=1 Tax=Frigidibacter sp. SD6-1 TaxID=3032581 RepID=UPI0024DFF4A3|nr:aspartate aminotransferase [Frigidibacter sp. SD6-1]
MRNLTSPLAPEIWLRDLFTSKAVQDGAVIRRKARDIERFAGMERFMAEVQRRGYQVAETGGQIIIFCNRAPVRWLTSPPAPPPIS